MLYLTKRMTFSASHRLYNPEFSFEKNEEIFDKCNNPNGHGHNYVLQVTVKGKPDINTGYVMDLKKLKKIMNEEIIKKVDHKNLNFDVEFMQGIIPTVEHLAVKFWEILEQKLDGAELHHIRIFETESSWVDYYGEPVEIKNFQQNEGSN